MADIEIAITSIYYALPLIGSAAGITFLMALIFTGLLTLMTTIVTWLFLIIYTLFTLIAGGISFFIYLDKTIPY